jgi:uncharacterized protein YktB (UPF0637 family)
MKTRTEIINEALRIRRETKQIITDTQHWNDHVRKPEMARIDPDPTGQLVKIISAVENGMKGELLCVHVIGPDAVHAAESLAAADKTADELNALFATFPKTENSPRMEAVVQAWPYSAESHASSLLKEAKLNKDSATN